MSKVIESKVDGIDLDAKIAELEAREKALAEKEAQIHSKLGDVSATNIEGVIDQNAYYEEYVPIYLFKDNGKYKDDVFVAVNGVGCQIQRGVEVQVKRKFKLALDQMQKQDTSTANLIEQYQAEYANRQKELN